MATMLNTTMNGTQSSSCYNPTAANIGQTFAYCLIFVVSMAGNIFIGIIVYKTKTMRKPINFLIVNMAMSDLLFPIFLIPEKITALYVESWLISGPLGQALCKVVPYLGNLSFTVSIQSLVLIAVDRFGAVVFPLRSPLISSKLCPFFILATWIVAMVGQSPYLFALKLVEYQGGLMCGTICLESGTYSLNFACCKECGKKEPLKITEKSSQEDDNGEELVTCKHVCPSCDHLVTEHEYTFRVEGQYQGYMMTCLLCGTAADSVSILPENPANNTNNFF
ncbi:hypothetical protein ACROYT_G042147 [Oculina patagonica]